jgi:hypothetical protein
MSRPKYPPSITEALKTHDGAKSMVKSLYESNQGLEQSLRSTQDELETYRSKFHDADKTTAVLSEQNKINVPNEIIKFVASTLGAGGGVSLFFAGHYILGGVAIVVAIVIYVLATIFPRNSKREE